jgi:surfeit locus 1 family protein
LPGRLQGVLADPPAHGIRLGRTPPLERLTGDRVRLSEVDFAALSDLYGRPVFPLLLHYEPDRADGYVREWPAPGAGDERHVAYAVQWFSMAAVVAGLYLFLNLHKRPASGGTPT